MSHLPARRLPPAINPTRQRGTSTSPKCQRGIAAFTLVEMLIAMVLTLIMVAAIAEFYAYVGENVRDGRAMIEMGGQLRAAVQRLKSDFNQITSSVVPWADDGSAQGYFEYREGPASDFDSNGNAIMDETNDEDLYPQGNPNNISDLTDLGVTNLLGDADDYLAFTIRSDGEPFTGRRYDPSLTPPYAIVKSQLAEVVWFTSFSDLNGDGAWDFDEPRTIHRRILLIVPGLVLQKPASYPPPSVPPPNDNEFHHNDISAHFVQNTGWVSNTLADLTRRENRFAHHQGAMNFPNALLLAPGNSDSPGYPNFASTLATYTLQTDYQGEDIVLSNVLAFDVRAYDPEAILREDHPPATPSTAVNALAPPDVGYLRAVLNGNTIIGTGAYVDLGYGWKLISQLQTNAYGNMTQNNAYQRLFVTPPVALGNSPMYYADQPAVAPGLAPAAYATYRARIGYTYDTWSLSYERDGLNQDNDGASSVDESTNGIDDDNANGVDDYRERETVPPYPQPLRGLQVKIRMYEPGTRQMRQATVTTDFMAE